MPIPLTLKPLPLWSFCGAVYNPKKPEEEESDKPPNEASKKNSSKKRKILPGPWTSLYAEPVLIKSLAPTTSESSPVSPALCLEDEVDAQQSENAAAIEILKDAHKKSSSSF